MNPFGYLGRASSPEMAGIGSPDPENKDCGGKILLPFCSYRSDVGAHTLGLLACMDSYQAFQHMIAKPFVGILLLSVVGIPWAVARQGHAAAQSTHETHNNSASTSTSCVPESVGGYTPPHDDDDDDDDDAKPNTALRVRVRLCAQARVRV